MNRHHNPTESEAPGKSERTPWERAATHSSAEVLAILAPTPSEPSAIQTMAFWKTGPRLEGSAA